MNQQLVFGNRIWKRIFYIQILSKKSGAVYFLDLIEFVLHSLLGYLVELVAKLMMIQECVFPPDRTHFLPGSISWLRVLCRISTPNSGNCLPNLLIKNTMFEKSHHYCSWTEMWNEWPKRENRLIPCKGRHSPTDLFTSQTANTIFSLLISNAPPITQ